MKTASISRLVVQVLHTPVRKLHGQNKRSRRFLVLMNPFDVRQHRNTWLHSPLTCCVLRCDFFSFSRPVEAHEAGKWSSVIGRFLSKCFLGVVVDAFPEDHVMCPWGLNQRRRYNPLNVLVSDQICFFFSRLNTLIGLLFSPWTVPLMWSYSDT